MTKVDMNRTLREKTDFVDKIIQFKGIDPEKTQYYENTHHQMTNSHIQDVMNTAWELDDDELLLETNLPDNNENMTTDNENENIISSNPILQSNSQNSDLNNPDGRVSHNSSISTDSEGIELNENSQQSGNKRIKIDNTTTNNNNNNQSQKEKSSSSTSHPILTAESSNHSSSSSSSTVKSSSETANNNSNTNNMSYQSQASTISEVKNTYERERVPHSNNHQDQGTPIHRSYPNSDSYDPELLRLQNFTVKQLKNFLSAEAVNFDGLLEKHELYNKAKNLILDRRNNERIMRQQVEAEMRANNQSSNSSAANGNNGTPGLNQDLDKDICKVCWDAAINCVLLECGHMCACITCSKKLLECPICRQNVVRAVHVFRV